MERRKGFTLIELVVVVMILGILAAVAVPKLLTTTATATDNGLRQSLAVIRNAVEVYAANNGGKLPGGTSPTDESFKTDLKPYLRGEFPKCPVGAKDAVVKFSQEDATATMAGDGSSGWRFNTKDGRFIANTTDKSSDGVTTYDKF